MATAVRRKPVPVLDTAGLADDVPTSLPTRHSFALYAASPLPQTSPAPPTSSTQPHYTRRRTQSTASSPTPRSSSTRTRLARLLHPNPPPSPTRKISGPSPVEFPPDMLTAELVALKASSRPFALMDLPVPPAMDSPPLSAFSTSASSRSSADTDATTPPVSPIEFPKSSTSPSEVGTLYSGASSLRKFGTSWSVDGHSVSLASHAPAPSVRQRPSVLKKSPSLQTSLSTKSLRSAPLLPLTPPTSASLAHAARLPLISPTGVRVPFGVLLGMSRESLDLGASAIGAESAQDVRRTLVVFLRHFWCSNCSDYLIALARGVRAAANAPPQNPHSLDCPGCTAGHHEPPFAFVERLIDAAADPNDNTHLLLIAPGAHTLSAKYLASFKFPSSEEPTASTSSRGVASIRIFVDPSPTDGVYSALGMGWVGAPPSSPVEDAAASGDDHADPTYATHGTLSGIGSVLLRAVRSGLPIWAKGGDIKLLGGEFVFECGNNGSLRCTYAHRMQNPRGHAGVKRVLAAAGVHVPAVSVDHGSCFYTPPSASLTGPHALANAASSSDPIPIPDAPRRAGLLHRFGGRSPPLASKLRESTMRPDVERPAMPTSTSMPAKMGLLARAADRVGVIWEGIQEEEPPQREPAIPATLSASSSRPWALAANANSSVSLLSSLSSGSVTFSDKAQQKYAASSGTEEEVLPVTPQVEAEGYMSGDEADGDDDLDDVGVLFPRALSDRGHGQGIPPSESIEYEPEYSTWEDVSMRARALSLARLRAKKEVRRGVVHGPVVL
ncbi:hypothetical protein MKEN_01364400 [Mycena kentingensis (nom. inval.)]|nr:hypothetical protein MKEN_01364400 [Mycena kentingensis (nom. inval.)]